MRRLIKMLSMLAALAFVPAAQAKVVVVTTTQDPAAITRAIGGERVDVLALAKGYQDPHYLDPKPSYMLKLHRADLVEVIGLDLEIGYMGPLLTGARNPKIMPGQTGYLDLSTVVKPLEVVSQADRSQGDVHPLGNPHYWLDPENGRLMAREIAARLTRLDPEGKDLYEKNLAAFEKTLDAKEQVWAKRMAPLAGQPVITYHRSWSYFAARYRLNVVGYVEPKPGIPPTPVHTLEVIKLARAKQIKLLLMENFYDDRVPKLIADKSGCAVAVVPNSVGGADGVDTYFDLLDRITGTIDQVLEK